MPRKKGSSVSSMIFNINGPSGADWPVVVINSCTNNGVSTTPMMFDNAALNKAPATLPCATAVNTTDVEIVEGRTHK